MKSVRQSVLVVALLLLTVSTGLAGSKIDLTQPDGTITQWTGTGSAADVNLARALAGERNTSSATLSYMVARQESNLSVISKTTAVTINGGVASDSHLMGVQILTALTGTCVIAGFQDSDGTAQSFTIPVGASGFKDFFGAINAAGALTVTCSNAADDNLVLVLWRPR